MDILNLILKVGCVVVSVIYVMNDRWAEGTWWMALAAFNAATRKSH